MELIEQLMALENRLARGSGAEYEEILADDAIVVVPGAILDKPTCVAAMNDSPGWDRIEMGAPRVVARQEMASVVYEFSGWREQKRYDAVLASTYIKHDDGWQLVLHQQTPVG